MNSQDIFNGITEIRDDLTDVDKNHKKKKKYRWKKRWTIASAAVLAVAVSAGVFLRPGAEMAVYAVAEAVYPEATPYPSGNDPSSQEFSKAWEAWREDFLARQQIEVENRDSLEKFFARSSQTFLTETEGEDQNRVYSPMNAYMALSMLAQLTDGESRNQILSVLGSKNMESLRSQASDVWNSNYRNDGAVTSILASSLWLNKDIKYKRDTIETLAKDFYASSYQGEMGSRQFNKALRSWLDDQTGGLLKNQTENIEMTKQTVMALATTLYFNAKWGYEFTEDDTVPKIFHSPGGDVETDFMHQREWQDYCWGNKFSAVSQRFAEGGEMWFVLPDDGVTVEELLSDEEALDFLYSTDKCKWENSKTIFVNKAIPKFDVSSDLDLCEGFQKMGITDIFDEEKADFSSMINDGTYPIVLSNAKHAARVVIDEKGCTAAAFTIMIVDGSVIPPSDEIDFVLDRPFLFCITGDSGMPLFVGIVNTPVAS